MFGAVPGLQVISSYRRRWLLKDVVAGVVLTTLLVPQGMAYAVFGPYLSWWCPPSRRLGGSLGYSVALVEPDIIGGTCVGRQEAVIDDCQTRRN